MVVEQVQFQVDSGLNFEEDDSALPSAFGINAEVSAASALSPLEVLVDRLSSKLF